MPESTPTNQASSQPHPSRRRLLAGAALLLIATTLAYQNSLEVPFIFDDGPAITRNETIRRLWPPAGVLFPPGHAAGAAGRPLVNLSLAINYAWAGLDVRVYHATNLALHAAAVLVLWGVLRRTLPRAGPLAPVRAEAVAFGTALLWGVHPLLTESVVCVVQRSEVMGGLFLLLTLYGFIRSLPSGPDEPAADPSRRRWWPAVAVGSCLLGVASKEIVAAAPLLALLYDRTFGAGSFRGAWRQRGGLHLRLAGSWVLLAFLMTGDNPRGGTVGVGLGVSSWDYLLTQCRALVTYLKLSFWPDPLVLDYGMHLARSVSEVWWQGSVVLALLAGTLWALWRRPVLGFVGAWFFVILAPSSSFVPLITQTIAEHRMYLPLAAVLVLVVSLLHCAPGRVGWVAVLALAITAGWRTHERNDVYRDERRLWSELVTRQPGNARAHVNLAEYLGRQDDWAGALHHYSEAVRLMPDYADAHNGLGDALGRNGRPTEALAAFELAHWLKPEDPLINYNLGNAFAAAGRLSEALARFEESLRVEPHQAAAHNNLGLTLTRLGRRSEAMEHFLAGLRVDPAHAELRGNVANELYASGQWAEAAAEYARVLDLRPDFTAVRQQLALTLLRLGRAAEALPHFERALAQLPESAPLHHNYAVALARMGRVAEAIAHEEIALRLNPDYSAAREHLALLRAQ